MQEPCRKEGCDCPAFSPNFWKRTYCKTCMHTAEWHAPESEANAALSTRTSSFGRSPAYHDKVLNRAITSKLARAHTFPNFFTPDSPPPESNPSNQFTIPDSESDKVDGDIVEGDKVEGDEMENDVNLPEDEPISDPEDNPNPKDDPISDPVSDPEDNRNPKDDPISDLKDIPISDLKDEPEEQPKKKKKGKKKQKKKKEEDLPLGMDLRICSGDLSLILGKLRGESNRNVDTPLLDTLREASRKDSGEVSVFRTLKAAAEKEAEKARSEAPVEEADSLDELKAFTRTLSMSIFGSEKADRVDQLSVTLEKWLEGAEKVEEVIYSSDSEESMQVQSTVIEVDESARARSQSNPQSPPAKKRSSGKRGRVKRRDKKSTKTINRKGGKSRGKKRSLSKGKKRSMFVGVPSSAKAKGSYGMASPMQLGLVEMIRERDAEVEELLAAGWKHMLFSEVVTEGESPQFGVTARKDCTVRIAMVDMEAVDGTPTFLPFLFVRKVGCDEEHTVVSYHAGLQGYGSAEQSTGFVLEEGASYSVMGYEEIADQVEVHCLVFYEASSVRGRCLRAYEYGVSAKGRWRGRKAGGCISEPSFANNTCYKLYFPGPFPDSPTTVSIVLWQSRDPEDDISGAVVPYPIHIGFYVFDKQLRVKSDDVKWQNARGLQISMALDQEASKVYYIVPCTFKAGQHTAYYLQVLSDEMIILEKASTGMLEGVSPPVEP